MQFLDIKNPMRLKHFTRKNKRCDASALIPYIRPSLSKGHQAVLIRNRYFYRLMVSGK